jgi:hypothetical protein
MTTMIALQIVDSKTVMEITNVELGLLKKNVAYLLDEDFGKAYSKYRSINFDRSDAIDDVRDSVYRMHDAEHTSNLDGDIIDFLLDFDLEGYLPIKTVAKLYTLLGKQDDNKLEYIPEDFLFLLHRAVITQKDIIWAYAER